MELRGRADSLHVACAERSVKDEASLGGTHGAAFAGAVYRSGKGEESGKSWRLYGGHCFGCVSLRCQLDIEVGVLTRQLEKEDPREGVPCEERAVEALRAGASPEQPASHVGLRTTASWLGNTVIIKIQII